MASKSWLLSSMTMSAPRLSTSATLAALVVMATVAPRCFASWMANVPTPPDPAWMKTFCPCRRLARSTSACFVHRDALGERADRALVGAGVHLVPTLNRRTPGPTRTTSPAMSLPKMSGIR
jgi:hypothetical protein